MHATHPHPRRVLAVTAAALALTIAALVAPATVSELDVRFGGGATSDSASPSASAAPATPDRPAWVHDPLRSPLDDLRAPAPGAR